MVNFLACESEDGGNERSHRPEWKCQGERGRIGPVGLKSFLELIILMY